MKPEKNIKIELPPDLEKCVQFHGHLCQGLIYGYIVGKTALKLCNMSKAKDEEIVAIAECDSCAVDALQSILGTSIGKGNLTIRDYGKNAYTVFARNLKKAWRFSKKEHCEYEGENKEYFEKLDIAVKQGRATEDEKEVYRKLKVADLLAKNFDNVFTTKEIKMEEPAYAELADSKPCAICKEMTMSTKMVISDSGKYLCIPCSEKFASV